MNTFICFDFSLSRGGLNEFHFKLQECIRACVIKFNILITQACDQKTFLTRVAVSYAFFRADNGKNSEKVPSRTIFAQISIFDFGTQWITTGC